MITWAETVDPKTSYSKTESFAETGRLEPYRPKASSDTYVGNSAGTTFENWSLSSYISTELIVENGTSTFRDGSGQTRIVVGKINSYSTDVGKLSSTVRSVLNTTSTTTSRPYTYRATGTTTATFRYAVSTQIGTFDYTSETQAITSTITTSVTQTTTNTAISTTTVTDETIATPIVATVVVAETDEVIWVANSSAATNTSNTSQFYAATAKGTTCTRTTIMPWTKTMSLSNVGRTQTTTSSLAELSQSIKFTITTSSTKTKTAIRNVNQLPHSIITTQTLCATTATQSTSALLIPAETITVATNANSKVTTTVCYSSFVNVPVTMFGSSFASLTTKMATSSRETNLPTAINDTYSSTYLVPATSQISVGTATSSSATSFTNYTWTGSALRSVSEKITTFEEQPQFVTTVFPENLTLRVEGITGFYDNSNVAAGYTCSEEFIVASDEDGLDNKFASVSRGVLSIIPTVAEYTSTSLRSDSIATETYAGGYATFSGLSVTLDPIGTRKSTSFVLQTFGSPEIQVEVASLATKSLVNAENLGQSETVYQTLPRGVYSEGQSTFSTSGGCSSWQKGGSSREALFPISFIAPTTSRNGNSPIWWTVSRNSHESILELTQASAYSQV